MKPILVTGGSGGIGGAIVEALAKEYQVFFTYHCHAETAQQLAERLGHHVTALPLDVRSEVSVQALQASIHDHLGETPLWGLVNACGVDAYGLLQDISLSDWQYIMDTNVNGTFLVTKAFLPEMIHAKTGAILNLSSIWGARGAACEVAYSTSKGAIDSFTRALAQEVAYSGIRVNALAPGVVQTAMFDHLSKDDQAATVEEIPFQRPATPEEIAQYARFLLSDEATYLTGQIITVAGGFVI